jgi:glycosyltransferase involved in cell wall biosynthesis
MSRTIWVASELYYPELTSTGFFMTGIAEKLAQRRRVEVLCGQPTYSMRGTRHPRIEIRNGVRIWRAVSTTFDKNYLVGRALNTLTLTTSLFLQALRKMRKGDQLLVVTNPPVLPFAMVLAARLRGVESALLIHDLYPDVLVATGMVRANSWIVRGYSRLARWLYRSVDRVVVLGRDARDLVARHYKEASDKVSVIPNWGDTSQIRPSRDKGESIRRRMGLQDNFVVQHLGNMGRTHGIESMVDAATLLRDNRNIHFMVVGAGFFRDRLLRRIEETGLTNISVVPPCADEELGSYLNACDIALISFRGGMAGVSVPSRMYNVMAAGKPILAVADTESELARVVSEESIGIVVPPEDSRALAAAILAAAEDPVRLTDFGRRARLVAENRYSADAVLSSYLMLFGSGDGAGATPE